MFNSTCLCRIIWFTRSLPLRALGASAQNLLLVSGVIVLVNFIHRDTVSVNMLAYSLGVSSSLCMQDTIFTRSLTCPGTKSFCNSLSRKCSIASAILRLFESTGTPRSCTLPLLSACLRVFLTLSYHARNISCLALNFSALYFVFTSSKSFIKSTREITPSFYHFFEIFFARNLAGSSKFNDVSLESEPDGPITDVSDENR